MKVFIAGGGTGGHIYPALSIAQALNRLNPKTEIVFIGTIYGMEKNIIPKSGYRIEFIKSGKWNMSGRWVEKIKTIIKIPLGILQSCYLLLKEKPDFVLGVGGYASAPFLLAASLLGKKTALWEPNAHPGMANRVLSRFVGRSYLVFDEAKNDLHSKNNFVLGMPLRYEIENHHQTEKNKSEKFTLLCFGGSQGSQFLNTKLSDFIINNPHLHDQIYFIHQTGKNDYERIKNKYSGLSCVEVHDYIYDMPAFYQKADLLFCRGGASTLAEAAVFGVVPVVVPLPAADNHQEKNADSLVVAGAGFMMKQNQFDDNYFKNIIESILKKEINLDQMSKRLKQIVPTGASDRIAQDIILAVGKIG